MVTHDSGEYELLDRLAEEFAQRYRRGERPSLKEYLDKYPDLAGEIRDVFPAMVEIEQAEEDRPEPSEQTGAGPVPPPRQVGEYRILREVGRGGMGAVYEAEQLSLGRRVALKPLPFATTLDAKQLQRFKNEAHAAAHLHHNNIVPVYATGCERGVHFYAMQFIEGQTLAAVIRELRRGPGEPVGESEPAATPHGPGTAGGAETLARAGLATEGPRRGRDYFRRVA